MRNCVIVVLLGWLACPVMGQEKAAPKSDRQALIGTWLVLEFHDDGGDKTGRLTGRSVNSKDKPELLPRLVFTETECYVLRPSKDGWLREVSAGLTNCNWASVNLDETAKPYKGMIITRVKKSPTDPDAVMPGIYELDGKNLRICYNETPSPNSNKPPTELKSDGAMNLFVCEKISDEPLKPAADYILPPPPPKPKVDPKPSELKK